MKERLTQKMTYLGVGAGLIIFALFGLLPGSFIGGVAGLSIIGAIAGTPVEPGIISRVLLAVSMLTGVLVSGLICITASSTVGWLIGRALDSLKREKREMVTAEVK